jgi:hypothetical protein
MSETPERDVVQVGLPESIDTKLKALCDQTPWFKSEDDVYRVAVAVALANGWSDEEWRTRRFEGGKDTKYRVVLLDDRGQMKEIISLLAPECGDAPYRYSQWLAVTGVNFLHQKLLEEDWGIDEALGLAELGER